MVERNGEQGHRYPLTRGDEHVEFAPRRVEADLMRHAFEPIGRLAGRGNDDQDLVAGPHIGSDPFGDGLKPGRAIDRSAAVLVNPQGHRLVLGASLQGVIIGVSGAA
jgi:hypothetical protein